MFVSKVKRHLTSHFQNDYKRKGDEYDRRRKNYTKWLSYQYMHMQELKTKD